MPGKSLEKAYEGLRMKVLSAGNTIQSQSQLMFLEKGMRVWLRSMGELNAMGLRPPQASQQPPVARNLEHTAVVLLTDMALHTWKEAG